MSQQHAQFEEEFHSNPRSSFAESERYVEKPSPVYAPPLPEPPLSYSALPGQKLQVPVQQTGRGSDGGRIVLAVFSMIFVFSMFMVALAMNLHRSPLSDITSALSILLAFVFTIFVLIINLIVNRRH